MDFADDEEYCDFVRSQPTAEEAISLALRESRFVSYLFPPYSSGAGDMIEYWLERLKEEWKAEWQARDSTRKDTG